MEGSVVRVMGVDPGLTRCGLSMIEGGTGRKVTALDIDVVRTPADMDLAERLLIISDAAEYWMDTHKPTVVAVERVFAQNNVRTAMGTAQAGGVIALGAARRGIPVAVHTPSQVKSAVTGNGAADKSQVTTMVTRILGLQTKPTPADAADARDSAAGASGSAEVEYRRVVRRFAAIVRVAESRLPVPVADATDADWRAAWPA